MSKPGQTAATGWTVDVLRAHLLALRDGDEKLHDQRFVAQEKALGAATKAADERFVAQEKALAAALAAAEKAVIKSEIEVKEWRANANEWRGTIADRDLKLMPRIEAEQFMRSLADKIDAVDKRMDRNEGRGSGLHAGWGYLVGAVGLISTVIMLFVLLTRH